MLKLNCVDRLLPGDVNGNGSSDAGAMDDGAGRAVAWFAKFELAAAFAHARAGGIALHRFRHDLRRLGFGPLEPICHLLATDRAALIAFGARFGLRAAWIEPPKPYRPDLWHFDAFGPVLACLEMAYPPPVAPDTGDGTEHAKQTLLRCV